MSLNRKITPNKSKHLLVDDELKKLETFDSSYFIGKRHFEDGTQNYLVFQKMCRTAGNLKDCLTKELITLEHPIIVLLEI